MSERLSPLIFWQHTKSGNCFISSIRRSIFYQFFPSFFSYSDLRFFYPPIILACKSFKLNYVRFYSCIKLGWYCLAAWLVQLFSMARSSGHTYRPLGKIILFSLFFFLFFSMIFYAGRLIFQLKWLYSHFVRHIFI